MMEQIWSILQPVYGTYGIIALALLPILLVVLVVVNKRKKAHRKSQSDIEKYILEIGEIYNKTGPIDKSVKQIENDIQKYTGATHERLGEVKNELIQIAKTSEKIKKLAEEAESTLHSGKPMDEVEELIVQATEELDLVSTTSAEVDDFCKELYELELDVAEFLNRLDTSIEEFAPDMEAETPDLLVEARQKLSLAFDSKADNDPITAYNLLGEVEAILANFQGIPADTEPTTEKVMDMPVEDTEEVELSSEFFEAFSKFSDDNKDVETDPEIALVSEETAEAFAITPFDSDEPDGVKLSTPSEDVLSTDAIKKAEEPEFVLAESWLRDFNQLEESEEIETEASSSFPAVTESEPEADEQKLLEDVRKTFEVSDEWLKTAPPLQPALDSELPETTSPESVLPALDSELPETEPSESVQPALEQVDTFEQGISETDLSLEVPLESATEETLAESIPLPPIESKEKEASVEIDETLFSIDTLPTPKQEEPVAVPIHPQELKPIVTGTRKKMVVVKRQRDRSSSLKTLRQAAETAGGNEFQSLIAETEVAELKGKNTKHIRQLSARLKNIKEETIRSLYQDVARLQNRFDPESWKGVEQAPECVRHQLQEALRLLKNAVLLNKAEGDKVRRATISLERAEKKLQEIVETAEQTQQYVKTLSAKYKQAKLNWNEMAQRYKQLKKLAQTYSIPETEQLKNAGQQLIELKRFFHPDELFSPQEFHEKEPVLLQLLSSLESRDYSSLSQENNMVGV